MRILLSAALLATLVLSLALASKGTTEEANTETQTAQQRGAVLYS